MIYSICPIPVYITQLESYPKSEMIEVLDKTLTEERDSVFGDDMDVEQIHNLPLFQPLNEIIGYHVKQYLSNLSVVDYDVYAQKSWGVKVTEGGGVAPHKHENGHISCVFYVSLPEGCNNELSFKEYSCLDWLPINNEDKRLPQSKVQCKEGQLIIFPSMLAHGTEEESKTKEPRYSISYDMCFSAHRPKEHTMLDISKWKKL